MKQFRTFITEEIATDTKNMTNLLVDSISYLVPFNHSIFFLCALFGGIREKL